MFWIQILSVLVLGSSEIVAYDDVEELEDLDDDDLDYYTDNDNGQTTINNEIGESEQKGPRKFQEEMITRALSPSEIKEVAGAIKDLFSRMGAENPFTPYTTSRDSFNIPKYDADVLKPFTFNQSLPTRFTKLLPKSYKRNIKSRKKIKKHKKSVTRTPEHKRTSKYDVHLKDDDEGDDEGSFRRQFRATTLDMTLPHTNLDLVLTLANTETSKFTLPLTRTPISSSGKIEAVKTTQSVEVLPHAHKELQAEVTTIETTTLKTTTFETTTPETTTVTDEPSTSILPSSETASESEYFESDLSTTFEGLRDNKLMSVVTETVANVSRNVTQKSKPPDLDIPRLLQIIAGLASEFETNLTRKLNESLMNMTLPTCTTPTTEPPVTSEYDANYTGATIAKCFVCGLEDHGVPMHAQCADAFAGDFLPLVPVDPTAKAKISTFRKYCKYSNIPGYQYNITHPRHIYGRWSGGCAVRWIDLSGIYTQRTCRNKLHPSTGRHYASKRMAKLEKSLMNVQNGCITSPMATLVPLSRGISLYARFHACVCTGSWCNTALNNITWPYLSFYMVLVFYFGIT